MPKRWSDEEENKNRNELVDMYIRRNLSIDEIGEIKDLAPQTVFKRLKRLKIKTNRENKLRVNNQNCKYSIPTDNSSILAEVVGILLGDGHISKYQVTVNLGSKEYSYVKYVSRLLGNIFNIKANISVRKTGYYDVYINSVSIAKWLLNNGMVNNKVAEQVDIPSWVTLDAAYIKRLVRGIFDTDGSVYLLKHGIQISITNYSKPLLVSLQKCLTKLEYRTSRVGKYRLYITHRKSVIRFFKEIKPKNPKHTVRYKKFLKMRRSYSGNYIGL